MDSIRIIQLPSKTYVEEGDYIAIDNQQDGTQKVQFTNLFDSSLSQSDKIAPADAVGQQFTNMSMTVAQDIADVEVEINALRAAVGSPLKASTVAQMTDTNKIYVYTGSESGYTAGNWYYYNGTAWASGGVYNSIAIETDKTLTVSDMAADAKVVGDDITDVKSDLLLITTNASIPVTGYDAYIDLSGDTADIDNPTPSTSGYSYSVVECLEGDVFTISGTGAPGQSAWGFLDASGNVLKREFTNTSVTNVVMCAPYGSKYLVINRNNGSTSYYGELITDRVTDNADDIKKADSRFVVGKNLIDPDAVEDGFISNPIGTVQSSTSYKTSDFIPVKAGQSITISPNIRKFLAYDAVKYPIFSSYVTDAVNTAYTYTAQVDGYIRVSYAVANAEQAEYGSSVTTFEAYRMTLKNAVTLNGTEKTAVSNMIDAKVDPITETESIDSVESTTVTKTDANTGYYNQNGYYEASSNYYYSDLIPVKAGDKVISENSYGTARNIRYVASYNSNQQAVSGKGWNNNTQSLDAFIVPDGIAFVRVSLYVTQETTQVIKVRTTDGITNVYGKTEYKPLLNGKKWVACGDSFTQGDFSGLQAEDFRYQDGKYVGKNRVYPFIIGLRTGAEIVNEAISGSTMAYVDGNRNEFSTPSGRYTQIPVDADYITLYFGINDSHHQVPIGTISDNVNTTFYGAWNIVMQYLIANHPNAKIGIIISNGCDTIDYPNAEIEIAKKYGVSYLDFNSDYKVPILFRVNGKPDTDASIITANYQHYRVSSSNGHPNVAMHEYESTIIQHWLESM